MLESPNPEELALGNRNWLRTCMPQNGQRNWLGASPTPGIGSPLFCVIINFLIKYKTELFKLCADIGIGSKIMDEVVISGTCGVFSRGLFRLRRLEFHFEYRAHPSRPEQMKAFHDHTMIDIVNSPFSVACFVCVNV